MGWTLDKVAVAAVFVSVTVLSLQASGFVQLPAFIAQAVPVAMLVAGGSGAYILYKLVATNKKPF